jgi:phosphatidylglycerophosphate synthase
MSKEQEHQQVREVVRIISRDRNRTNLLRNGEQKAIAFLVQYIPSWMTSNMLTAIGFAGNILILASFLLAAWVDKHYLLGGVAGFLISWFGDSLDGRIAYYRRKPRKWYGFSLDLTIDWLGTFLIGLGFIFYADSWSRILGYIFVVLYGWEIIIALIRYTISGKYSIDSGLFGPTEVRIIISLILVVEVIFTGSLLYFAALACLALLIINLRDSRNLLRIADERDQSERVSTGSSDSSARP